MATVDEQRAFKQYGFTNDLSWLKQVEAFRDAAVADGWSIEPTYASESVERAANLHKNGFTMSVLTRDKRNDPEHLRGKWAVEAHVSIWGPDGLALSVPESYDWQVIQEAIHTCDNCKKRVEQTHRYSFAGRCCAECLPAMRKKYEYRGWCD
jgi:hypothetical protein